MPCRVFQTKATKIPLQLSETRSSANCIDVQWLAPCVSRPQATNDNRDGYAKLALKRPRMAIGASRNSLEGATQVAPLLSFFSEDDTWRRRNSLKFRRRHGKMWVGVGRLGKNDE